MTAGVQRRRGILLVGIATAFAVTVAVAVSTLSSAGSTDVLVKRTQVAACERGNIVRAFLTADAMSASRHPILRGQRARALFPILDCAATVEHGSPVALPANDQAAYINKTVPALPR